MNEEWNVRLEKWLDDTEKRDPLKLFMLGGIALIVFFLFLGFVTSREVIYPLFYIAIKLNLLDSNIPLVVVDVVRHAVASALISYGMLAYFVDLETAWLFTQRVVE